MGETGFTRLPHALLNVLIFIDLTQRQWLVILVVLRLSYGCRQRWATLKLIDFEYVGIDNTHIREVIDPLIDKKILLWEREFHRFRINEEYIILDLGKELGKQLAGLSELIWRNLSQRSSQNGNRKLTNLVTKELPEGEYSDYQYGNFVEPDVASSKDKFKYRIKKDKGGIPYKGRDPNMFVPMNSGEEKALETWEKLESDKPDSFDFYLNAHRKGLPNDRFDYYAEDILSDPKIKNKGAAFVRKVEEYFKNELADE